MTNRKLCISTDASTVDTTDSIVRKCSNWSKRTYVQQQPHTQQQHEYTQRSPTVLQQQQKQHVHASVGDIATAPLPAGPLLGQMFHVLRELSNCSTRQEQFAILEQVFSQWIQ